MRRFAAGDGEPRSLLQSDHRYKYLDSFITLFVVILIISNVVAAKFFAIGPLRDQRGADDVSHHVYFWRYFH